MKAYPKYKDCEISKLIKIPYHWSIVSLKYLLLDGQYGIKIGPFGSTLKLEIMQVKGYKVYGQENIIKNNFKIGTKFISENKFEELKVYKIEPGDIVITMMGTTGKAKVVPVDIESGIINSHLIRIRCNYKIDPNLITILINNSNYIFNQIKSKSKGAIMEGLNSTIIKTLQILLPPKDEQGNIIKFIDHKTAQIDTLVEKKKRLIELLKEERTAVINQAVTKGLDPNVPMKESGIEWLGEIPEHWEVKRIKFISLLSRGVDLASIKFIEGKYPVYGSNGIIGYHNEFTTKGHCVTVGRSGSVGEVNYVKENFWAHNTTLYVINFYSTIPKYAFYLLKSLDLKSLSSGSAVGTLNRNNIHQLKVGISKSTEQKKIVQHIEKQITRIDTLITKTEKQINLLQEYRTALISEVVTGKIDVRDWKEPK